MFNLYNFVLWLCYYALFVHTIPSPHRTPTPAPTKTNTQSLSIFLRIDFAYILWIYEQRTVEIFNVDFLIHILKRAPNT